MACSTWAVSLLTKIGKEKTIAKACEQQSKNWFEQSKATKQNWGSPSQTKKGFTNQFIAQRQTPACLLQRCSSKISKTLTTNPARLVVTANNCDCATIWWLNAKNNNPSFPSQSSRSQKSLATSPQQSELMLKTSAYQWNWNKRNSRPLLQTSIKRRTISIEHCLHQTCSNLNRNQHCLLF